MEKKVKRIAVIGPGNQTAAALEQFTLAAIAASEKIKLISLSIDDSRKRLEAAGKKLHKVSKLNTITSHNLKALLRNN